MRIFHSLLAGALLAAAAVPAAAQPSGRVASPRDTVQLELPPAGRVLVDYGRPFARGRAIMGQLVPYGRVWRTGANAATTLVTEVDLRVGDARVPRGTYTLYTLPSPQRWQLIVSRQTGQWGTQYDASRDLARVPMQVSRLAEPVEQFTIRLEPVAGRADRFQLAMEWETTRVVVPVRVEAPAARRAPR